MAVSRTENMQYFISEMSQMDVPSLNSSSRRAQGIYDENLAAYIKIVFRRPFAKIIVRAQHFVSYPLALC